MSERQAYSPALCIIIIINVYYYCCMWKPFVFSLIIYIMVFLPTLVLLIIFFSLGINGRMQTFSRMCYCICEKDKDEQCSLKVFSNFNIFLLVFSLLYKWSFLCLFCNKRIWTFGNLHSRSLEICITKLDCTIQVYTDSWNFSNHVSFTYL